MASHHNRADARHGGGLGVVIHDSEEDEDYVEEDEHLQIIDLFDSSQKHSSVELLVQAAQEKYNFSLPQILSTAGKDDYDVLKIINFIRKHAEEGAAPEEVRSEVLRGAFRHDMYLKPHVADDPLLSLALDLVDLEDDEEDSMSNEQQELIENLQAQVQHYKDAMTKLLLKPTTVSEKKKTSGKSAPDDAYYFDSYSHIDIHEVMISDASRTDSYKEAVEKVCKNKTVLDVGCGTGILSLFAARAGAKEVVGVDASEMGYTARDVVRRNRYEDRVRIIKGLVEDVKDLDKVDVLVSEWMGFALLFESMLDSVIDARDKYLKKDTGVMIPSHASMFLQAYSHDSFWQNVYGFDFSCIEKMSPREAEVMIVPSKGIVSDKALIKCFNLATVKTEELDFDSEFTLTCNKNQAQISALVLSFDCAMCEGVTLSTAPESKPTHWKQTVLWLDHEHDYKLNENEVIEGKIRYCKHEVNPRNICVTLRLQFPTRFGDKATVEKLFVID